jgi:hypothetical protein
MNPAAARTSAPPPVVFRDAFGERRRIVAPSGSDALDVLCLRAELTAVPSFEFALRERVSRLAAFRHPFFAHIRTVERLSDTARTLAIISNAQAGTRVSEMLTHAAKHDVVLDSDAAMCLIRQLVAAMATFHEQAPDVAHGALGPERVIVTPNARLVIVEHVMGSAIEQLQYSEDRYWRELRVPCPRVAGAPVIDHRADVLQLGMLALALLLRRSLNGDEFPSRVGDAVVSARAMSADGHVEALPSGLRPWLTSTLQLDPRTAFSSAIAAREELEKVFERNDDLGAPSALEAFLARYNHSLEVGAGQAGSPVSNPVKPPAPVTHAVAPQPVVKEPAPAPIAVEAPAPEPVMEQSLLLDRLGPRPAEHDVWSEPNARNTAQEPLRPEVPLPVAESPSLALLTASVGQTVTAKPNRPIEPAHKPTPSHTALPAKSPFPSHTSISPHTSISSHAHLDDRDSDKESTDMSSSHKGGAGRAAAAVVLLLLAGGGTMAARRYLTVPPVTTGTVVVTTNPPGAQVLLDGALQGVSPTTLTVTAGTHALELRGAGDPRKLSLDVAAGAQLSQYIELTKGPAGAGSLQVRTEPAGAKVSVDGVPRGASPVIISDLSPGEHLVAVEGVNGSTKQTVTIEAGATASLVANLTAAPVAPVSSAGWISVSTPKTVQLFEDGRLLGNSDSDRLMMPAGTHQLDIVNDALGYRSARTVVVLAGKVSPIKIEFPQGVIALNAVPWADVWIDGEKVGETPIGNLPLTIGTHEIIFRHPDFGEQRQLVTITLTAPTRLSVDMRKKP